MVDYCTPFVAAGSPSLADREKKHWLITNKKVGSAESYTDVMHNAGIAINIEQRKKTILEKSTSIVKSINGSVIIPSGLLDEVVYLVEAPHPVLGKFSETFLELPKDLLIMVMQKHQKYFAVTDQDGKLLPYFIAVANGEINEMVVRKGNEAVLRARYEDAKFSYELDTSKRFSEFRNQLKGILFHAGQSLARNENPDDVYGRK